jgi:hypothetical protein
MNAERSLTIENDAISVLVELRRALIEVVSRITEQRFRPKDLQLKLGVEYKLCWQVLTITRTEDPLSISQFVPGITSVRKFLAAVRPLGVPEDLLGDVERAMDQFQNVVEAHSDDRRGFDSMVTTISGGEGAELIALQHRRDAFRSESQIWGSQVEVFLRQMFVRKSENGTGYDRAFIGTKIGIRCLRQGVMPILHGYRDTRAGGRVSADEVQPLDADAAEKYGAPVVPEFCTQPIPTFTTVQSNDGWIHNILSAGEIGRKSAINMTFAGIVKNMKQERDEDGMPAILCGANTNAPTELSVVELFVHRPSFGQLTPRVWVHSTASGAEIPEVVRMSQPLPIYADVEILGPARKVPRVREIPNYRQQTKYLFDRLNWDPAEFDLFRLRIPYPILHTRARITCLIPDKKPKAVLPASRDRNGHSKPN